MSTMPFALTDSMTMLRRQLRHMQRYVGLTVMLVGMPVVFLLLFAYVFGGTMGAGLGGVSGSRADYINYVVPGIIIIAIASVAQGTAISVAMDMTEGIIARFRTMAIFRPSVLTGHVLGSMLQTALGLVVVIHSPFCRRRRLCSVAEQQQHATERRLDDDRDLRAAQQPPEPAAVLDPPPAPGAPQRRRPRQHDRQNADNKMNLLHLWGIT